MNFIANNFKKLTLLSAAGYIFMFVLAAKGVFLIVFQHPPKKNLLLIEGIVKQVRLGGQGNSTYFLIKSDTGTYRYSSYYGKVWSGMERIHPEDSVQISDCATFVKIGELKIALSNTKHLRIFAKI